MPGTDFLSQDHISYQAESRIRQFIKPLEKLADIHYFCYGEHYPDTSGFTLHTNSTYYESWFKNDGLLFGFHLDGWHHYDHLIPQKVLAQAHSLDLGNFVTYVERQGDKTVVIEFGSRPDNTKVLDFYKENTGLLKRFGHYFANSLATDIITTASEQRIIPPERMINDRELSNHYALFNDQSHAPLDSLDEDEKHFLGHVLKGYSNNDIASLQFLSNKSISRNFIKIKKKLQCTSKSQLFEKAERAGFVSYEFAEKWLRKVKNNELTDDALHAFLMNVYSPFSKLSAQEYQCYQLLLSGHTLAEISKKLAIGIPTAADYIWRLKNKLGCKTKVALFHQAIEHGLMNLQSL